MATALAFGAAVSFVATWLLVSYAYDDGADLVLYVLLGALIGFFFAQPVVWWAVQRPVKRP